MPRLLAAASLCLVAAFAVHAFAQTPAPAKTPHPVTLDDLFRFVDVAGPQVSPDGKWVAYTVSHVDTAKDKRITDLWMVSWDGSEDIQLTYNVDSSAGSPRWSPDGKYLSFTADRPGAAKGEQVWVMNRRGGEARQLTDVKDHLSAYAWSPDGKKLLLALTPDDEADKDKKPADDKDKDKPKPIVIDRYHFKEDVEGYLTGDKHTQLWLWDVETHKLDKLTTDTKHDETNGVWAPDGSTIAYVSNHDPDPDRSINNDVFAVAAKPHSEPRKLTTFAGSDGGRIVWSPDSKSIAFLQGSDPKYWQYSENHLGIVAADGSAAPRIVDAKLDRSVSMPEFTPDGKSITVLVEDDRSEYPASIDVATGEEKRLIETPGSAMAPNADGGHTALLWTTDSASPELYALEDGSLRRLTHHNDTLLAELKLGETRDVNTKSKDGTDVHGLITLPPDAAAGKTQPTLLFIHGGPDGQDAHGFNLLRQLFAAHGYAVLNVNYRGSAGRGSAYQQSIFADWGHYEVEDLLASVDQVVKDGIADPDHLAVGGWSYGGILTDYTIASTTRFKAASSGAGTGNPIALFGIDEYIYQYQSELGYPWQDPQKYIKLGYPLYHADRIKTPTLYMGGDKDFNVPLIGGEQMYEALRALNVPSELIVYPGQFHGFTRPSFIRDRYQRWFNWYDKWVLGKTPPAPAPAPATEKKT
jgi:dipeptidyl aminopeptidase/acylaminoacyl peptidase